MEEGDSGKHVNSRKKPASGDTEREGVNRKLMEAYSLQAGRAGWCQGKGGRLRPGEESVLSGRWWVNSRALAQGVTWILALKSGVGEAWEPHRLFSPTLQLPSQTCLRGTLPRTRSSSSVGTSLEVKTQLRSCTQSPYPGPGPHKETRWLSELRRVLIMTGHFLF